VEASAFEERARRPVNGPASETTRSGEAFREPAPFMAMETLDSQPGNRTRGRIGTARSSVTE